MLLKEEIIHGETHEYDVIILGAGLSGLYAASILKEHNVNFAIVEARNRVGGRTLTKREEKVGWVDLGGSYVGPQQLYMQTLIKKFNLKTYKVHSQGKSVYLNKKHRFLHSCDKLPSIGSVAELEIRHILRQINQMCSSIPLDKPWKAPHAAEWDRLTFAQFLDRSCWTQEAKDFISLYMSCCTSCESHEGSLLWTLWFTKQCEGLDVMYNIEGSAQDSKICGGTQQISEKLLELIDSEGERVFFEKPVIQIICEEGNMDENNNRSIPIVTVKTLDGTTFTCHYLINTIPISLQQKIHFTPSLPPLHNQLIQKFPMGSVIKCIVYYRENFWRRQNLNGNLMINLDTEDGPITYTLDDTKPDGTFPAIVGFIIGDRAKTMLSKTREERLKLICDSLAKALDSDLAKEPIHYEEKNWMSEQYTGGCFTAYGQPGFLTTYGDLLRKPLFGCIYPAGTETSIHWSGYMEGALQSGERASNLVLKQLGVVKAKVPIVHNKYILSNLWRNIRTKKTKKDKKVAHLKMKSFPNEMNLNLPNIFALSISQLITWSSMFVAFIGVFILSNF